MLPQRAIRRTRSAELIRDEMSTAERQPREGEQARVEPGPEMVQELVREPAIPLEVQPPNVPPPPPGAYQTFLTFWAAMHGAAEPVQVPVAPEPVIPEVRVEAPPVQIPPFQPQPAAIPQAVGRLPIQISKLMKEARQLGCEAFNGTGDISVAQLWLERVTQAAEDLRLADADKVILATRLLEGDARTWWGSIRVRYTQTPSWEEFARVFDEQYYTRYHRNQMVADFYRLTQGTSSVLEYETEFRRLARFVPDSERADEQMAHRFEEGLSAEIRTVVGTMEARDLRTLVTAAQKAERVVSQQRVARGQHKEAMTQRYSPWKRPQQQSGLSLNRSGNTFQTSQTKSQTSQPQATIFQLSRMKPATSVQSSASVAQSRPLTMQTGPQWCRNCGGNHLPPCPQPMRCFVCGRTGHFARQCPSAGASVSQFQPSVQPDVETQNRPQRSVRPVSEPTVGGSYSGRPAGRPPQRTQTRLFTLADAAALANSRAETGINLIPSIAA